MSAVGLNRYAVLSRATSSRMPCAGSAGSVRVSHGGSVTKTWEGCSQHIPISSKELSMTSVRTRMTEDMQVRNLALNTQMSYAQQVSLFARYFDKSPELLGPEDIRTYQVYLTNEKKLAPSSVNIAVSALRFLYKVSLHKDWSFEDVIPAPRKPQKLP